MQKTMKRLGRPEWSATKGSETLHVVPRLRLPPLQPISRSLIRSGAAVPEESRQGRRRPQDIFPADTKPSPPMKTFRHGKMELTVPVAYVETLPENLQAAIVGAVFLGILGGTYVGVNVVVPYLANTYPGATEMFFKAMWPTLGATYGIAGVVHFTNFDECCMMYPKDGAWGFWYLPGGAEWNISWVSVCLILGSIAMMLTTQPGIMAAVPNSTQLALAAAYGEFITTWAVLFSDVFMMTHNAPGPGPLYRRLPPGVHVFRAFYHVILLTLVWECAHGRGLAYLSGL